ncbi:MAG: DUF1569 domain-containing protein [Bacteroidota bacterium]
MKTIFDKTTSAELISRINSLNAQSKASWGKMDAYQMVKHCRLSEEMYLGKKAYRRLFIGRLFGKMALNGILKNTDPMKKNQPTHPDMKITGAGNFETEKQQWISLLHEYAEFPEREFTHPFFGKMTKDQIGVYIFKHTDHHLRQFNN